MGKEFVREYYQQRTLKPPATHMQKFRSKPDFCHGYRTKSDGTLRPIRQPRKHLLRFLQCQGSLLCKGRQHSSIFA